MRTYTYVPALSEDYPRTVGSMAPAEKGVESDEVVGQVTRDVAFEKRGPYAHGHCPAPRLPDRPPLAAT